MKKNLFLVSAIFLISTGYFSCGKNEDCKKLFSDNIIGRWKLIEVSVWVNYSPIDTTDYSKENIIFDFQENNKLIVTGNIPNVIAVFDDFQVGEHFYEFSPHLCGSCPGPNLRIDIPDWNQSFYCDSSLDEETMWITGDKFIGGVMDDKGGWIIRIEGADAYQWKKTFIKIK